MSILTAREYAKKYAGGCSSKTIIRRIQRGDLPTNHQGRKVGNQYVVEIGEFEHLSDYNIILEKKKG